MDADAGTRPCPADPSKCGATLAECHTKIGCDDGTKFCGFERVAGVAVMSTSAARGKPICKQACAAPRARDPLPVKRALAKAAETALPVTAADSDRVCFQLKAAAGAISDTGNDGC